MKNRIRVERAEIRMTQQQLADAIGVSRQTVNAIEAGRFVPSTVLALKIARIFGKPVEQVFHRVFYPRVSRSRLLSRISRYVVGQFTFTFVVVNGNFHREMWLATSFPWQQMARVTPGSSRFF